MLCGISLDMPRMNDKVCRCLKVPLRAFCCKARGGGGRLRHANGRIKKEDVRWVLGVIKAEVAAESRLHRLLVGVVVVPSITLYSMLKLLTITPDRTKMKAVFLDSFVR